jgi:hypothetical protein
MTVVTSGIELATFRLVGQYDNQLRRCVLSLTERFYCVTSYLTEKLSKLRSFDIQ